MKVRLKLPKLSMSMEEGTLTDLLVEAGSSFQEGQPLYAVETDKATTEVEAPCAGRLLEWLVGEGSDIEPGTEVCVVEVRTA